SPGPCRYLPCAVCPLLSDVPNWTVDPQNQRLTIRSRFAEVDLSSVTPAELIQSLGDPTLRWVPVSEAPSWLDDQAPRFAAVTRDGSAVPIVIGVRGGLLQSLAAPSVIVNPPGASVQAPANGQPPASLAMALSGSEGAVFVLGGDGQRFRWFDVTTRK